MRRLVFLFICFTLQFCSNTFAQNPFIRHYTTLNGLPTNTIYQIYQDSHKFLWFTSDAGVVKFDGTNFTSYRKKDGLSSNEVVRIKEDSKGRIWIFNYNGSVDYILNNMVYNGKNSAFLNSLQGTSFIVDFLTDFSQTVHFYNWQREVFSLDSNNRVSKNFLLKNVFGKFPFAFRNIENRKILYLSKDQPDELIIWSSAGIYKQQMYQESRATIVDSTLNCRAVFPADSGRFRASWVEAVPRWPASDEVP